MKNYLDAPIMPAIGAAGIKIGDEEKVVVEVLGNPLQQDVLHLGSIKFTYDSVVIWFDKAKRVDQIRVFEKYRGSTSDGVFIGITKSDLQRLWGWDLAYYEDGYWEFVNRKGTLFNFVDDQQGMPKVSEIFITV